MSEDIDILEVVHSITLTDRQFYSNIRYFDSATRNNVVLMHERNTREALGILRSYLDPPPPRTPPRARHMVFTIPLDVSGNFFDPVIVRPTPQQIERAVQVQPSAPNTTCVICQGEVRTVTMSRIRHCGHCFHDDCLAEWFTQNPRCPTCRYDIRQFTQSGLHPNNDSGVHTD
jgi:hypothetical protein